MHMNKDTGTLRLIRKGRLQQTVASDNVTRDRATYESQGFDVQVIYTRRQS